MSLLIDLVIVAGTVWAGKALWERLEEYVSEK